MYTQKVIPFRKHTGLPALLLGPEKFTAVEQESTPTVWGRIHENPKCANGVRWVTFRIVQLKIRVDLEGVRTV
jgi:hypothetical protein